MDSHSTTPRRVFCELHAWWYYGYCCHCEDIKRYKAKRGAVETRTTSTGVVEFKCKKHDRWYLAACVTCLFETRLDTEKPDEPKPLTRIVDGVVQFRCKTHEVWYTLQCMKCMVQRDKIPHNEACLCSKCKPKPLDRKQILCTCIACTRACENISLGVYGIRGHDTIVPGWPCTCLFCVQHQLKKHMVTNPVKVTITKDPRKEGVIGNMDTEKKNDKITITIPFPSLKVSGKWFRSIIGLILGATSLIGLVGLPILGGLLLYHNEMHGTFARQYQALWFILIGPVTLWFFSKWWRGSYKDPSGWDLSNN